MTERSTRASLLIATPRLADEVRLDTFEEQHFLYNRANAAYVLLDNAVAREVARLIDGHRRVQDICDRVGNAFAGATSEQIASDVLDMLAVLDSESFITLDSTR